VVLVKICGVTRLEDAELAVRLGARAIGFVFWPKSPRYIEPLVAREISDRLPPFVSTAGVFVNQEMDEVRAIGDCVRLHAVQLHGDESPAFAAQMNRSVVKAITSEAAAGEWDSSVTLLLDAYDPDRRGGTGTAADWEAAARLAARRRVLLAGGLTPANVAAAVARVRPYGIDVSSGVESAPGLKDPGRLAALFRALHESEYQPARS
jgi:phosphoribosylanthranilate isomerase